MTLKQLISDLNLNWVNSDITPENFPKTKEPRGKMEIVDFGKYMSTEEVKEELDKKGLRPATIYELLTWAKDNWNGKDWVVALGSVSSEGGVPFLIWYGAERSLDLYATAREWIALYRFLVFGKSASNTLEIEVTIGGEKYKGRLIKQ